MPKPQQPGGYRRARRLRAAALGVLASCASFADQGAAQAPGSEPGPAGHVHEPLAVDATLTWDEIIAATLAAHPRQAELVARSAEAEAWDERGRRWLATAPSLYFSYLSDSALDDRDQREYEGGVELPLWRIGQRSAVQALAESTVAESEAARAALRLEVAGLLRGILWDIEAAANAVASAAETLAVAEELVRVVELRNERGDLPLNDVLLARAARLERQQAAVAAEGQFVDAERAYRSLTGLDRRPVEFSELPSSRAALDASHPLLALANAEVERARASVQVIDRDARGTPTLAIGPRRQRDPLETFYNDSVAVAVSVPVGGKNRAATLRAQNARLAAGAEAARGTLLRQLDRDLHEAEHTLLVLDESLVLAEQRAELTQRQWQMARSAFAQGEIELRELLRVQDAAQSVSRDVQRLRVERQRTIAAYNQAVGEIP